MGATKVAANFDDIEREAIMAEKLKIEVSLIVSLLSLKSHVKYIFLASDYPWVNA